MRPLQESLVKASSKIAPTVANSSSAASSSSSLPPPLPMSEKATAAHNNRMFSQTIDSSDEKMALSAAPTKMQLLNDNISSYKCFETIATPSPVPIAKNYHEQLNNLNNCSRITVHHRSTSLDSLANSEQNFDDDDDEDEEDDDRLSNSPCGDSCCSDSDHLTQSLSDCDSINEICVDKNHQPLRIEPAKNCACECDCSATQKKPIVTDVVKKSSTTSTSTNRQCTDRDCAYKQFDQHHSIDDCAPSSTAISENDQNLPFLLNDNANNCNNNSSSAGQQLQQQQQQKTRRTSIASSGSVGRMETIIEEPIEPKISVKEILARFETLTSLEVKPKLASHK